MMVLCGTRRVDPGAVVACGCPSELIADCDDGTAWHRQGTRRCRSGSATCSAIANRTVWRPAQSASRMQYFYWEVLLGRRARPPSTAAHMRLRRGRLLRRYFLHA